MLLRRTEKNEQGEIDVLSVVIAIPIVVGILMLVSVFIPSLRGEDSNEAGNSKETFNVHEIDNERSSKFKP